MMNIPSFSGYSQRGGTAPGRGVGTVGRSLGATVDLSDLLGSLSSLDAVDMATDFPTLMAPELLMFEVELPLEREQEREQEQEAQQQQLPQPQRKAQVPQPREPPAQQQQQQRERKQQPLVQRQASEQDPPRGLEFDRATVRLPIDLYESDKEFVLRCEVPGVDKAHIAVELGQHRDLVLYVHRPKAEVVARAEAGRGRHFLRTERARGGVQRRIILPLNADCDRIAPHYSDNGILTLRIGKKELKPGDAPERQRVPISFKASSSTSTSTTAGAAASSASAGATGSTGTAAATTSGSSSTGGSGSGAAKAPK